MILKALKYKRFDGQPREWSIVGLENPVNKQFAYFGNFNLLVGKNAAGKSRILDAICTVASLISKKATIASVAHSTEWFDLIFDNEGVLYTYKLSYTDRIITDETLSIDKKLVLDRSKNFFINPASETQISSMPDSNELAISLHIEEKPIFPNLVLWAESLRNFLFTNQPEKNHLTKDYKVINKKTEEIEDVSILINTFYRGSNEFGKEYISEVIDSMSELGYGDISNIEIQETKQGYGICIEENASYKISQRDMSQGLFRILSIIIQLTYVRMSKQSICVLVDDIGEGLDYERSKALIDIFIKKISQSNIQFFMTTNDRYIMNKIPLKYWTVIARKRTQSILYNYENSHDIFEDFKYTGLNNFDFLTTDFYSKGFGSIDE